MITQYVDQSVAIRESVTGQAKPQYILRNVPTGVSTSKASQVPTVPRLSSPAQSVGSGSQIWIITTEAPTNLSHYSSRNLGNVSLNLSAGAPTLSVTPTALLEGNQRSFKVGFCTPLFISPGTLWIMGPSLVIGDDTEMMHTFDSKLWDFLHLFFLVDMVYKIFTLIFCVNAEHHFHQLFFHQM